MEKILKELYEKYYIEKNLSGAASSHWEKFQKNIIINKNKNIFKMKGYGFGNHRKNTILNYLISTPERLLLNTILKEYQSSNKAIDSVKEILKKWDILFGYSHLKNLLSFETINSYKLFNTTKYICIIGDGYGFLGSLIKLIFPNSKIIFINLGRVLMFDVFYSSVLFENFNPLLLNKSTKNQISKHEMIYLEAENSNLIKGLPIGLFINIASMQEMSMKIIDKYFYYMRSSIESPYFYCCNRLEKKLPDGSIIKFMNYPWRAADEILFDELAPWYQSYPINYPPFWKKFDGPIHHRLVKLDRNIQN